MRVASAPPTANFEPMRIISDPIQYGPAGTDVPTDQSLPWPSRFTAEGVGEIRQEPAKLGVGDNKFAVFEPDSLVEQARSDALSEDSVAKLNAAKKL
jgi:hypothetical protein